MQQRDGVRVVVLSPFHCRASPFHPSMRLMSRLKQQLWVTISKFADMVALKSKMNMGECRERCISHTQKADLLPAFANVPTL